MHTTGPGGTAGRAGAGGGATLLAVGAGQEQLPAIEAARRLGHRVVAVDPDPGAPGLALAEVGVVADLEDAGTVIAVAAEHGVAAVVPAPGEGRLPTVGRVNDALGLRGVSHASALACADATRLQGRCLAAGVRRPAQVAADGAGALLAAVDEVGRPCLLRPAVGIGGEAAVVVRAGDGGAAVAALVDWHLAARAGELSVVEPLLGGRQVGVDGAVVRGALEVVLLRTRELAAPPLRAPVADLAPARLEQAAELAIRAELELLVRALALTDCLLHATVDVADGDLVTVLAAAACPAGDHLADALVPAVTGVAYLEDGIRLVLGEEVGFAPGGQAPGQRAPAAARRRLTAPASRVTRSGRPPRAAADPDVVVYTPPGPGAAGTVVTRGPDAAAAAALAARVVAGLDVEVDIPSPVPALSGTAAR